MTSPWDLTPPTVKEQLWWPYSSAGCCGQTKAQFGLKTFQLNVLGILNLSVKTYLETFVRKISYQNNVKMLESVRGRKSLNKLLSVMDNPPHHIPDSFISAVRTNKAAICSAIVWYHIGDMVYDIYKQILQYMALSLDAWTRDAFHFCTCACWLVVEHS